LASYVIINTIDFTLKEAIKHLGPHEVDAMWEILMEKTTSNLLLERFRLFKEIVNLHPLKGQSVSNFVSKMEAKIQQLHSMSSTVRFSEETKIGILLTGVQASENYPDVYKNTVDLMLNMNQINYPDVTTRLNAAESNKRLSSSSSSSKNPPGRRNLKIGEYEEINNSQVRTVIHKSELAKIDCKYYVSVGSTCFKAKDCLFLHDKAKEDTRKWKPREPREQKHSGKTGGKKFGHGRYPGRDRKKKKCETCGNVHAKVEDCAYVDASSDDSDDVEHTTAMLEELGLTPDTGDALHQTFKDFMVRGVFTLPLLLMLLTSLSLVLFSSVLYVSVPYLSLYNSLSFSCTCLYEYCSSMYYLMCILVCVCVLVYHLCM
jgi:hypothetical protein